MFDLGLDKMKEDEVMERKLVLERNKRASFALT